jgi:TrmH family RNA methyltransferase
VTDPNTTQMQMAISSTHNDKLKEIRKLHRRRARDRAGRFVAEGEDLLAAADAAGWTARERYCAAGSGLAGVEVEPRVLASASALGSGTRALAVYEERWGPAPCGPLCVYLHGVGDPGNVGAVLRSAQAFGASSVALGPGSADPFGPKAVRASMGAVFAVPVVRAGDLTELPGQKIALVAGAGEPLSELWRSAPNRSVRGVEIPGKVDTADAGAKVTFADFPKGNVGPADLAENAGGIADVFPGDFPKGKVGQAEVASSSSGFADLFPLTLLIGGERDGLPDNVVAAADQVVHIPIHTHSLNAAMAATVALYEVTRMAPR